MIIRKLIILVAIITLCNLKLIASTSPLRESVSFGSRYVKVPYRKSERSSLKHVTSRYSLMDRQLVNSSSPISQSGASSTDSPRPSSSNVTPRISLLTAALKQRAQTKDQMQCSLGEWSFDPCNPPTMMEKMQLKNIYLCLMKKVHSELLVSKAISFFDTYLSDDLNSLHKFWPLATVTLKYWPELLDSEHRFDLINLFHEWETAREKAVITSKLSFEHFMATVCDSMSFPIALYPWTLRYCTEGFSSTNYLTDDELERYVVSIQDWSLVYSVNKRRVCTNNRIGLFVITKDERLIVYPLQPKIRITSITHGLPVVAAGYIIVRNGMVLHLTVNNDAYKHPVDIESTINFFLKSRGYRKNISITMKPYRGALVDLHSDLTERQVNDNLSNSNGAEINDLVLETTSAEKVTVPEAQKPPNVPKRPVRVIKPLVDAQLKDYVEGKL